MSNRKGNRAALAQLVIAVLLATGGSAAARQDGIDPARNEPAASPQQGPTDHADLESCLDGLLVRELAQKPIAGAAVSVVKDGAVAFVHRFGSYLNSHVYFHVLVTDGVFSADGESGAVFHPAPDLGN